MANRSIARWTPLLILVAVVGILLWNQLSRRRRAEVGVAYVSDPAAVVWNANAQVRQQTATLRYGERVSVLQRTADRAQIRSESGTEGWVDASTLMDESIWQQGADLLTRARKMPVQARGHTRTISNVRLAAGRDGPRIYQFGRNEPVVVLERATSAISQGNADDSDIGSPDKQTKMEDWLLIMRDASATSSAGAASSIAATPERSKSSNIPVAGWVLERFVELDPPAPIPDYFSASGIRVVAWAVLNTVSSDGDPKPQYLVAGGRGGEGQPCDFTLLRVYTWGSARERYETAYIENNLCGRMPITVTPAATGADFKFADPSQGGAERLYAFRQTVVRRVFNAGASARKPSRTSAPSRQPTRRKK